MYYFEVVLLPQKSLVCVKRAIRVSLVLLSQGKIAQIPLDVLVGVNIFLDSIDVQKSVNTNVVDASVVSGLLETLSVYVCQVCSGNSEPRGYSFLNLDAVVSFEGTFGHILVVECLINEEVISESPDCKMVELEVSIALLSDRAGVEEEHSVEVESEPVGS